MNPTSKPVTITLGDRDLKLFFNFNTYAAFQERTGQFWMDWYFATLRRFTEFVSDSTVVEQIRATGENPTAEEVEKILGGREITNSEAMFIIKPKEMQALIWAAAHHLDKNGEVEHEMTYGEVGEILTFENFAEIMGPILAGVRDNLPKPKAAQNGDSTEAERPTKRTQRKSPTAGGASFGPSDEEILTSAIKR